jgi:hypothetical protein
MLSRRGEIEMLLAFTCCRLYRATAAQARDTKPAARMTSAMRRWAMAGLTGAMR